MQKHLFWYPWVCIAMLSGILICAALILRLLLKSTPEPAVFSEGIQLVKEAMHFAAL